MKGKCLEKPTIRVLVVDDYEPWRRFEVSRLADFPEPLVIDEASDGPEAVQKAQELQPALILLDIGLPTLNGIEAARRIRNLSPTSKILFVSQNLPLTSFTKPFSLVRAMSRRQMLGVIC